MLDWVYNQVKSILNTISSIWSTLNYVNNNVWNYVRSEANSALSSAKSYVDNLPQSIRNFVYNVADSVRSTLSYYVGVLTDGIAAARVYASSIVNNGVSYAINVASAALQPLYGLIDGAKSYARGLYDAVKTDLTNLISGVIAPFTPYLDFLGQLVTATANNGIARLTDLLNRMYYLLVDFTTNPASFILTLLWGKFQTFLCFSLAYGLGTLEDTLPPVPDWSKSGGANVIGLPPGTVVGQSGLLPPVQPLYISGTTFSSGHPGTDFGIVDAQPIYAAHPGVVAISGWSDVGYGNNIVITGDQFWSRYAHLKQPLVSVGDSVFAGQLIAYGDSTGNSTGPHLHFELKINGAFVDPAAVYGVG
jgi:hypothetical protein